jgi:hypothetical protein
MLLPTIIFTLFALACAAGAYALFSHHRGRGVGLAAAAAVLVFFAGLMWMVLHLLASSGVSVTGAP